MTPLSTRLGIASAAAAGLGALSLCLPGASAGQPRAPAAPDALQVLADVVLIESECSRLGVDYGRLFAFAERNGIRPVDVMPLGARRAAFDADLRRRARGVRNAELCGPMAAERAAALPGVFTPR